MSVDRRRLITGLAGAAGALAASRWATAAEPVAKPLLASGKVDWSAVRALFDLDPALAPMSSFLLVSYPRPVREAIDRWRRRIDANPFCVEELFFEPGREWQAVKAGLARYLGAAPEHLAWVPNTTTGLSLVYNGLDLAPGDEVLTSEHDHYSHHQAIALAVAKRGATQRRIPLHDGAARASRADMVGRLRSALRPETRAIGLTWVHSSSGLKLPIAEMAEVVHAANRSRPPERRCLLVVDGVHGFGVEDVDAASLGADFFVAGAHKYFLAPRGTGVIVGRADAWPRIQPTVPTFDSFAPWLAYFEGRPMPPTQASFITPGGFVAYENLLAMEDAVALHDSIGRAAIAARITELAGQMRRELARMRGVTLITPLDPDLAAGIICFEVGGRKPEEVALRLRQRGVVATASPYAVSYARVAAGIMVQPADVERTLREVRAVAA